MSNISFTVGYDSVGRLKLFDFGFASSIDDPTLSFCGTMRYMSPEVGLEEGCELASDVYSFGVLLWEVCALKRPFEKIKSVREFKKAVFEKGARPAVKKRWPRILRGVMEDCWLRAPCGRPLMSSIKDLLMEEYGDELSPLS